MFGAALYLFRPEDVDAENPDSVEPVEVYDGARGTQAIAPSVRAHGAAIKLPALDALGDALVGSTVDADWMLDAESVEALRPKVTYLIWRLVGASKMRHAVQEAMGN